VPCKKKLDASKITRITYPRISTVVHPCTRLHVKKGTHRARDVLLRIDKEPPPSRHDVVDTAGDDFACRRFELVSKTTSVMYHLEGVVKQTCIDRVG
jgi:hypothetical protein